MPSNRERILNLTKTLSTEERQMLTVDLVLRFCVEKMPHDPGRAVDLLADGVKQTFAEMFEAASRRL